MPDVGLKYNGEKITLREFDQWRDDHLKIHDLERDNVENRFEAADKARGLAKIAEDYKVAELNNLRRDFEAQQGRFLDRPVYDADKEAANKRMAEIEKRNSSTDGKVTALIIMFGLAGIGIAVLEMVTGR